MNNGIELFPTSKGKGELNIIITKLRVVRTCKALTNLKKLIPITDTMTFD